MDKLRTDELKPGHRIKLTSPLPNRPSEEYAMVQKTTEVDPGIRCPIYRINFKGTTFALMADADRRFEVESSQPSALWTPPR